VNVRTLPRHRSTGIPRVRDDLAGRASVVFAEKDDQSPIVLPENLEETPVADLEAIRKRARAAVEKIKEKDDVTDEDVVEAERLAEVIKGAKAEEKRRETADEDRRRRLDAVDTEEDDDAGQGDGDEGGDAGDGDQGGDDEGDEGDADADADKDADKKEPVLASAGKGGRAARAARRTGSPKPPAQQRRATITAAADVPGVQANHTFSTFSEVAAVANRRFASYPQRPLPSGSGQSTRLQHGVARIRRDFADDLTAAEFTDDDVFTFAARESRLPGGSLVAAGGWCAPSETLYDLAELEAAEGLIDLPEVNARRGGIRFTPGPDFRTIYDGVGFTQTEAQAIAGTDKTCYRVPCPDFTEVRAEAMGVCITSGILQNHAYPELTARITRGALVAHAHKLSARTIAKMEAGSTGVTITTGAALGATASLLSAVELAVTDVRYRHRLPIAATVEVPLPLWAWGVIRADLSQRLGVDLLNVTNATIRTWFAERGAAPQFVYDWQDSAMGIATPATSWPSTVKFLAYPAGTWVRGVDEVINLDTVYDSAGLVKNDYVGLFTEEAVLVAKTGHDSRVYTTPFPANGATRDGVALPAA
jgi:hypothetical protein